MVANDDNTNRKMHQLLQELLQDPLLSDIAAMKVGDKLKDIHTTANPRQQRAQKVDSETVDNETVDTMLAQVELMIQAELGGACRARLEREEHDPIGKKQCNELSTNVTNIGEANILSVLTFLQKS